ncbi:AAA family ATPase [Achromobacter kerstersii]|uniref:AAA family ATPase n=1 Tax=Achromobacter kerstersii TaxID=1353890 RepID=UPI0006BED56B|nr:AAA family ATPase [Achromobacter kerstersii]CUJ49534.1 Uncharacterized protein conserved in bacteria [Achromobacter kerstersii]
MLEKVLCIDNVGVIKKGALQPVALEKVALIYADNARGKSTLSSLLLACAGSDAEDVVNRKTVGATTAQKAKFRFASPEGSFTSEFDGSRWQGASPNLHVFNQAFVERNVFASTGVLPEQREALLTLALGDAAVAERAKFEGHSDRQTAWARKLNAAEGALVGFRGGYSVDQFIRLKPLADVDGALEEIDRQVGEARSAQQILARPEFKPIHIPVWKLEAIVETVGSSYETLAIKAEEIARAHFSRHNGSETERWVADGMGHKPDEECPFCGQQTNGVELLRAYRAYFDRSYEHYMHQVRVMPDELNSRLGEGRLDSWKRSSDFNGGLLSVWAESLNIQAVPELDIDATVDELNRVRNDLLNAVTAKGDNPHAPVSTKPFAIAFERLEALSAIGQKYNSEIDKLNEKVARYKEEYRSQDVAELTRRRDELLIRKNRFDPKTISLIETVEDARREHKAAGAAKDEARAALDKLMAATLEKFQRAINEWLARFGAPFTLEELAPTYRSGRLRSEYVLKVRGATVNVGPGAAGGLSFHSALSEGDKRTLAFAFFLAKLFADPKRSGASVVLDDVFTSLDKHRRHHTLDAVSKMLTECAQVIVLGHDAHFLRGLKKIVNRKKLGTVVELTLQRDAEDYSYLCGFDLDEYCSSEYYKHYTRVERFVNAEPDCKLVEVAQSLRFLVEGHMHRCFPKKFKEGSTVGQMLDVVKNAIPPNPLVRLQPLHRDLVSFNEFAAEFHHDTSALVVRTEVTEAELITFAKGALNFIQIRSFRPE